MSGTLGRRFVCLGAAALVSGCGFQPVYMRTASGKPGPAARDMQTVNVPVIADRPGQLLRQALQERLGSDAGVPPQYDLRVSFGISGEGIAVQQNNISTRVRLIGVANWTLVQRNPQQTPMTNGSARSFDAVNVFDQQYFAADLETEAVQKRIAEAVAQQIANQLAVWFRERASQSG